MGRNLLSTKGRCDIRIISKQKDYYDFGMCYGIDPKLVYERMNRKMTKEEFEVLSTIKLGRIVYTFWNDGTKGYELGLGFCGKLYKFVKWDSPSCYIWTYEDFVKYDGKSEHNWTKQSEIDFFQPTVLDDKYFKLVDSPIFLIANETRVEMEYFNRSEVDPNLKEIGFHNIMDATTCFNEISQYIGNVLNAPPEMVKVSDKERIHKAGFDNKSFKNMS
jgi:hypothetical protein